MGNLAPGALVVDIGMMSTVGPRSENQDAVGARVPTGMLLGHKGVAFAIADGVSASEAGRIAAETCVQNFLGDFYATPDAWSIRRSGGQVLSALNRWLLGQGLRFRDTQRGYVTTFTGCVLHGRQLHVFHVGDTRLYRLRNGQLELLTRDHRVLLDDGRPVLSRAMGLDHCVDIDYAAHEVVVGDRYLLLTDGIHDLIDHVTIARCAIAAAGADDACRALGVAASAATPTDNMSAVLVQVDALPDTTAGDALRDEESLPLLPVLSPGQRIDGLVVERVMAESPRSQVYRVRDEASGAIRVLKSPSPRCEDLVAVRREYATESWVLRRVQHPRLPRSAEPSRPRTALYVLTEPVDGISLRNWMREHRQAPVAETLQIARQVAAALRALHRRDIVHRDVRPENILLDANGQVTLIDLGQCRVAGLSGSGGDDNAVGNGPGALEYAAPECTADPQRVGERSDQFSLAAMVYEMLSGEVPFGDALVAAHRNGRFGKLRLTPAGAANPLVPGWIDDLLARSLALDPVRRYGDIAEFSDALGRPFTPGAARKKALLERNPLRFWQGLALLLAITNAIALLVLFTR